MLSGEIAFKNDHYYYYTCFMKYLKKMKTTMGFFGVVLFWWICLYTNSKSVLA